MTPEMGTASGLRILGRQEPWPASCAPDETSRSAPADSSSAANAGPTRGRPRSRAAREPGGRAACGRGVSAQAVWFHLATVMTPVAVKVPAAGSYCSAYSLASERHVRWCGRWGRVTAPGDPIHLPLAPRRRPGEGQGIVNAVARRAVPRHESGSARMRFRVSKQPHRCQGF